MEDFLNIKRNYLTSTDYLMRDDSDKLELKELSRENFHNNNSGMFRNMIGKDKKDLFDKILLDKNTIKELEDIFEIDSDEE